MSPVLFAARGGRLVLPAANLVLVVRDDGGHLVVDPPRPVWERRELTADELIQWSYLVAATGSAMIDTLPSLARGCLNCWEAGNGALNDQAEPRGPKTGPDHRRVHPPLLGRSPRRPTHPGSEARPPVAGLSGPPNVGPPDSTG